MTIPKRAVLIATVLGLLAAPPAASALMFTPAAGSPITDDPGMAISMSAAGDLNGDERDDIVFASFDVGTMVNQVRVMLAGSGETFTEATGSPLDVTGTSFVETVRIADFDQDGKLDLLAGGGRDFQVLFGAGDGTFANPAGFTLAATSPHLFGQSDAYANVIGDVDGDGDPDLAFGMPETAFDVIINNGDRTFSPQPPGYFIPETDRHPNGLDAMYAPALGDFNGDGKTDLAAGLAPLGSPAVSPTGIYLATGDGTGSFTPDGRPPLLSGAAPVRSTSSLKLNPDGTDDLAVAVFDGEPNPNLFTLLGGSGGLSPNPASGGSLNIGYGPYQQDTADLDGDGRTDIVTGIRGDYRAATIRNNGDGTISPFPGSPFGLPPIDGRNFSVNAIYTGDFNGDGSPDIAADSSHSGQEFQARGIDVLISRPHVTAPESAMFGNVTIGSSSVQPLQVENDGGPQATLGAVTITGPDADQFSVAAGTCGDQLDGGATCTREVTFAPTSPGPKQATLMLETVGQGYLLVSLSGTGVKPVPPRISLKLIPAGKIRPGGVLLVKARITNLSGGSPVYGIKLKTTVPGRLARRVGPVRVGDLGPGMSVTRKLRVKVRRKARKGARLKVRVAASAPGMKTVRAARKVKIR